MNQCPSCGGICKKSKCERADYVEPKIGCVNHDCDKCKQAQQDQFCDNNCVWTDHHPDCVRAQKQEPVAWIYEDELPEGYPYDEMFEKSRVIYGVRIFPVNVTPQRQWVGLEDEEIDAIYESHHNQYGECETPNFGYERAIESKLKEKNCL